MSLGKMVKAKKGKKGCLKKNGHLKKGWKRSKRKGFCIKVKSKKKGSKRRKSSRRKAAIGPMLGPVPATTLFASDRERLIGSQAMDGYRRR